MAKFKIQSHWPLFCWPKITFKAQILPFLQTCEVLSEYM